LNKISYNRFLETTDRGFDILTNDPLFGANSTKQVHQPMTQPKPAIWKKVEAYKSNGFKTLDAESGSARKSSQSSLGFAKT
jgi:hypothetical protein